MLGAACCDWTWSAVERGSLTWPADVNPPPPLSPAGGALLPRSWLSPSSWPGALSPVWREGWTPGAPSSSSSRSMLAAGGRSPAAPPGPTLSTGWRLPTSTRAPALLAAAAAAPSAALASLGPGWPACRPSRHLMPLLWSSSSSSCCCCCWFLAEPALHQCPAASGTALAPCWPERPPSPPQGQLGWRAWLCSATSPKAGTYLRFVHPPCPPFPRPLLPASFFHVLGPYKLMQAMGE